MQSISKQVLKLESMLDGLHSETDSNLGASNPITVEVLKTLMLFQGLKHDLETSKIIDN